MALVTTSQWLENGPRYAIAKFTAVMDAGSEDEVNVVKVDATSTGLLGVRFQGNVLYPGIHLAVYAIKYSVASMALRISWQATVNVDMMIVQATDHWQFLNERNGFGGLTVPAGTAGATGSILFSTLGSAANSAYTVILYLTKNIPTS
jgi:hypothetical protein